MAGRYLNESDHVIRQVPHRCQVRNAESGEFVGIAYTAFTLGEHEYLSVAWPEHFPGDGKAQNKKAISQLRVARPDKASTAYWIARISDVRAAMNGLKFRAISEPNGDFTSHAALRFWPTDDNLLGKLAALSIAEVILSKDIPKE